MFEIRRADNTTQIRRIEKREKGRTGRKGEREKGRTGEREDGRKGGRGGMLHGENLLVARPLRFCRQLRFSLEFLSFEFV